MVVAEGEPGMIARHGSPTRAGYGSKVAKTLGPALTSLRRPGLLHPVLKKAFGALYGYTSNDQGVRRGLLGRTGVRVGQDDAVFMLGMLGACASFAS